MKNATLDPPGSTAELLAVTDEGDHTTSIVLGERGGPQSGMCACAINHSLEKIITQ